MRKQRKYFMSNRAFNAIGKKLKKRAYKPARIRTALCSLWQKLSRPVTHNG